MARKTPTKSRKSVKSAARKVTPRRATRKVDFGDEEAVLKEVCRELDIDPSDCEIRSGSAPNGYSTAYTISVGRHTEYIVMENEDEFEMAARNGVENDLKEQPEIFNRNFIESHVDIKRLRDYLHSDLVDSAYDRLNEDAERHPAQFASQNDIEVEPPSEKQLRDHDLMPYDELSRLDPIEQWNEIGEEPTIPDSAIQELAESEADAQLKDPMECLVSLYGREDAAKKAIEFVGIDIEKAADEAVSTEGAEHFMCNYDGKYDTTKSGFLVWRHN